MSGKASFFNFSLSNILDDDQSILDQARVRLLYYGLLLVMAGLLVLLGNVYFHQQMMLTYTFGFLLVCVLAFFKYLTWNPNWHRVSHGLLVLATFTNLVNVFVTMQDVNLITVQSIILIIVFSFYMLGQSWGVFYSLANMLPVLGFMVLQFETNYFIDFKPEKLDQTTIILSVFANFILILFVQSHFYSAFITNIKEFKESSEEQSGMNVKLEHAIQKAEKSSHAKSEFLS
ncbi:MAG: hypothetical protein EOP46_07435, partial [Sphingobacteriaceae bacterium]